MENHQVDNCVFFAIVVLIAIFFLLEINWTNTFANKLVSKHGVLYKTEISMYFQQYCSLFLFYKTHQHKPSKIDTVHKPY